MKYIFVGCLYSYNIIYISVFFILYRYFNVWILGNFDYLNDTIINNF